MINIYKYLEDWSKTSNTIVIKSAKKELIQNEGKLLDNQEELHHSGLDRFGNELGRYSKATEVISGGRKKAGELFNLHDTGLFHDNMYIDVHDDGTYTIGSRDRKEGLLEKKLGKRIWGYTNIQPLINIIKDGIIKEINKI